MEKRWERKGDKRETEETTSKWKRDENKENKKMEKERRSESHFGAIVFDEMLS